MKKIYLNPNFLPPKIKEELFNLYPESFELNISGKERSLLTEKRIRKVLNIDTPKTTEYDFFCFNTRLELKQAEAYLENPKFQQVKPASYPYIICMLNHKTKSEWYLLDSSKISKKAGKKNKETGKICLNKQHRSHDIEGQINVNPVKENGVFLGEYEPLFYYKDDLNLSSSSILEIFNKIENLIK